MVSLKKCLISLAGGLLIVGSVSFTSVTKAAADVASGQKAVIFEPNSTTEFSSSSFDQSASNAIKDGANYVYLTIPVHQSNIYTNTMYASYNTPTDSSLQSAVSYIHSQGAHVAFSFHDDMDDGNWRSYATPTDRGQWFANYQAMLDHYAVVGQQSGVEEYVLGTEMTSMTDPGYNSGNTAAWQGMIASVRKVYSGKLTYSAQHNEFRSEVNTIQFWPQLDYIGISAYYSLGYDSSVSALLSNWARVDASYVQPVANQYGKQVLFTEVGYESKSGSTADPGASYANGGGVDLTTQANAYQALLQYWNAKSYWGGVAWWGWSSNPNAGGTNDTNYTPQNKPAEQTMKQWFSTGGSGGGPVTPPTPAANYTASLSGSTTPTVNTGNNYSYTVSATQAVSNALIDVEIYNAGGQQVFQTYQAGQTVGTGGFTGNFTWTPSNSGAYSVKIGVFTANWQQNLYWNNNLATITASATSTPTPPPPVTPPTPPTPPVTPPTNPTPTPTPPSSNSNVDIWWPSNGGAVSGVQPFKALIDGVADSQYNMYWQVDNGTLNLMSNATNPVDYKLSNVDLTSWNWQPSGHYVINFVANDLSGNVIASKSVTITVTH